MAEFCGMRKHAHIDGLAKYAQFGESVAWQSPWDIPQEVVVDIELLQLVQSFQALERLDGVVVKVKHLRDSSIAGTRGEAGDSNNLRASGFNSWRRGS